MELNDKHLLEECQEFDFINPPFDPTEFAQELVNFMLEKNALGVAANQIGVPYRIFAMRGAPENFVCFNPRVVASSEEEVVLEEGCLSYPNLLVKVKRPQHVRVRFAGPNGETFTQQFTGLSARVFQHEYEHLEGKRFFDNANKYHRDQAFRRLKKTA